MAIKWGEENANCVLIGSAAEWIDIELGSLKFDGDLFTCVRSSSRGSGPSITGRRDKLIAAQHADAKTESPDVSGVESF